MFSRIETLAGQIDAILGDGGRSEILFLLALLAGRCELARVRERELLERVSTAPARDLTVKEASHHYPVGRSFLYERGEALGLVNRTKEGKVVVIERALRAYLEGDRG